MCYCYHGTFDIPMPRPWELQKKSGPYSRPPSTTKLSVVAQQAIYNLSKKYPYVIPPTSIQQRFMLPSILPIK